MPTTLVEHGKRICKPPYDGPGLRRAFFEIQDDQFWEITRKVYDCTQLSIEALWGLYEAVRYVVRNHVPGDIVECGVYYGGSTMAIAETLLRLGDTSRTICMYDSFEMFTGPSSELDRTFDGRPIEGRQPSFRAITTTNVGETGYPEAQLRVVEGNVEDTLVLSRHQRIALLRLDTDTYHSTAAELRYLYPTLVEGGVLIIDDYGHAQGARMAVDDYFSRHDIPMLLNRTSFTCRMGVKVESGQRGTRTQTSPPALLG